LNAITPAITAMLKALIFAMLTSLQMCTGTFYIKEDFMEL